MTAETTPMAEEQSLKVQQEAPAVEEENCKVVVAVDNDDDVPADETEAKREEEKEAPIVEKNGSFREESNCFSDLKENEKKALAELREKIENAILGKEEEDRDVALWGVSLLPSKGSESTDVILLKFLRAREFKVKDAYEMFEKTLQWRKEAKIDSVISEEELGSGLSAACYMDGVDREGHPVCYNVYGVFADEALYQKAFGTEEKRGEFLRWRVQLMEKGIQKLDFKPGGVSSLLQITDLKNSPGISKKELRTAMKNAVQLLQDNYPEFVARNIVVNVPFWYYAIHSILSPFLTQRTKSKFVFARPSKVTETLLKYIPAEQIPVSYGGFKCQKDAEFSIEDTVSELIIKAGSTESIEIPTPEAGTRVVWDVTVLGWEVNYKEEFVPEDQGSYTIIVQKSKKMGPQEELVRNCFRTNEPGKVVITIENNSFKKKKVLYRFKTSNNNTLSTS
ncbi:putative major sperm protein (MSP) [Dioscorea sansibarensis]